MTTTTMDTSDGTWSITTRTIVYAAIGAALYAVFNIISFALGLPGHERGERAPALRAAHLLRLRVRARGGIPDRPDRQHRWRSVHRLGRLHLVALGLANGVAGLIAGLSAYGHPRGRARPASERCGPPSPAWLATVIGFLVIFLGLIVTPEMASTRS